MKKLIVILGVVAMAVVALAVAIFSIGTPKRWGLLETIGKVLNALRPVMLLAAIAVISPVILLSTASIKTDETAHAEARPRRLLGFVILATIIFGALEFFRSAIGRGDEEQPREHVSTETTSDRHDENAGAEAGASSTAEQAAAA